MNASRSDIETVFRILLRDRVRGLRLRPREQIEMRASYVSEYARDENSLVLSRWVYGHERETWRHVRVELDIPLIERASARYGKGAVVDYLARVLDEHLAILLRPPAPTFRYIKNARWGTYRNELADRYQAHARARARHGAFRLETRRPEMRRYERQSV
jgi:hypothetical protein